MQIGQSALVNREELGAVLEREGVNPDAYSLDGGEGIGERYVLALRTGGWKVFYAERGQEQGRRDFDTEDEACRFLLDVLLLDTTTQFQLVVGPLQPNDADVTFEAWRLARPWLSLSADDVRVDNPTFSVGEGARRRYWVRRRRLRDAEPTP